MLGRIRSGAVVISQMLIVVCAVPSHRGCDVVKKFSHLVIKRMNELQYTLLATSETKNFEERRRET